MEATYKQLNTAFIWEDNAIYGASRLGQKSWQMNLTSLPGTTTLLHYSYTSGNKHFEMSNHLGNPEKSGEPVLAVITDRKIAKDINADLRLDYFEVDYLSFTDYYPFGMLTKTTNFQFGSFRSPEKNESGQMKERSWSGGGYRYGFQGQEKDDEVKGEGNSIDFGARIFDSRLGRFQSVDPMARERISLSPFNFCSNNPISRVDPTGALDEWVEVNGVYKYDNRVINQEDAEILYGKDAKFRPNGYEFKESGNQYELGYLGFFKLNGEIKSSPDQAEFSEAYTNPEKAINAIKPQLSSLHATLLFYTSTRSATIKTIRSGNPYNIAAALVLATSYSLYIYKMEKEIEGIERRAGGPQGVQYALKATVNGEYNCFYCLSGRTKLMEKAVWKYGESINIKARYSQPWLTKNLVRIEEQYFGNQVQIKVEEKKKIYAYFLINGHLPPGNKIFR